MFAKSSVHTCESCTASFYKSQLSKNPYQLSNVASSRFLRTYQKCGDKQVRQVVCQLPSYCTPLLAPPEPIYPPVSRPRRKCTKPASRNGKCAPKIVIERRKPLKLPTPCQPYNPEMSRHNMTPCSPVKSPHKMDEKQVDLSSDCCNYSDPIKNEPSSEDVEASFCEQQPSESCEDMAKPSEKNISDYCYDNPSLKLSSAKKVSGCAELLETMDEDTELWVLQVPKSFDVNRILNQNLAKRKTSNGSRLDVCCNRFQNCVNMICLAPEKAAEYKTVCDKIKLINPVGKIMVTEEESRVQSDLTCSEEAEDDEEEMPCEITITREVSPVACKKVQKKVNDQRFTIETTVTVENVGNDRSKKARKSIKIEPTDPCDVSEDSENSPMKRKAKKC